MSKHDDGGPAYPTTLDIWSSGFGGMTLLDAFAKAAIAALVVDHAYPDWAILAGDAYTVAAAMIAEKRRREKQDK